MVQNNIPPFIAKYFWGDTIDQLDILTNRKYISQILLERGDSQAISWLLKGIDRDTIKSLLPTLRLSKKSANFWNIYFS